MGLGRVRDLLKSITELQLRNARHANPLTQLPGNIIIDEQVERMLAQGNDFIVAYCDLDHFKPFNDKYGYKKGDAVIRMVGQLLNTHIIGERDFVGHIGGDDFIVIMSSDDWQQRLQTVLDDFLLESRELFDHQTLLDGGYTATDRSGNSAFTPLLSLSIGVVNPDPLACSSIHDISSLASDAKKMAKKMDGNSLYIDRRRSPGRAPAVTNGNTPDNSTEDTFTFFTEYQPALSS
jgi:diguanylate cyclase (GGDEF)-like protein